MLPRRPETGLPAQHRREFRGTTGKNAEESLAMPPGPRAIPDSGTSTALAALAVALAGSAHAEPNDRPASQRPIDPPAATPPEAFPDLADLETSLRITPALVIPRAPVTDRSPPTGIGAERNADPLRAVPTDGTIPLADLLADLPALALTLDPSPTVPPDLDAFASPHEAADPFSVRFGRATTLGAGGFDALPGIDEAGGGYFAGGNRFDRYNLDLEWTPSGADASVQWLLLGGFDAVRADINGDPRLGLTDARGTVAIPTIGTGLRWKPSNAMVFSTTASTQSLDTGGGVVDISVNAEFRLSPNVGLTAGYEFYESSMTVENLRTTLDREGVFAKLTIRF
jgi:hypothetical protein